ncbi:MAG: NAD(P)/FAD-dependent oxidoreductase [Candidatus Bathyarchaeota archaeon]|nr:MAG: NAD(P)/FAD-dependent oxidoreductase [Candidatus Bathyarchaeota archaeon]
MRTEVAIVGAGPAGLIAALELARNGIKVKVFEEHPEIGRPNHCAGVLSVEGLHSLGIEPSLKFLQHEIRGGTVFSPDGTGIRVAVSRTRAYVVDRAAFDRHLAETAVDAGVEIETNHRIREFLVEDGRVAGLRGEENIGASIVIDAEGAAGGLARKMGLPIPQGGVLAGINVDVTDVELEPNLVEVWLGERLAPGLYAWIIPTGEGEARCGLGCTKGDAFNLLRGFLERRFDLTECGAPRRWSLLTGGPVRRTFTGGLLVVGDAAGQTKPTTGGGVILGSLCAMDAAETALEALEAGDFSADFLQCYERRWRKRLGKEFSSMLRARGFLNKIPDDRMDRIFASLKGAGLEEALKGFVEEGDMDLQSGVIRTALTDPGLLRVLAGSMGRLAFAELQGLFNL